MKVTFLSPALDLSGGSKVISIYATALHDMGHDVEIVTSPPASYTLKQKIKSLVKGEGWVGGKSPTHLGPKSDVRVRTLEAHRPIVDADVNDADVLIATWWETAEWANKLSPNKGRKIYFVQGHEVYPYLPARSKDTYKLPMQKIVVSKWLQDLMKNEYGDDRSVLVPNTVDRFKFYSPPRSKQALPTIGLLYSAASMKGCDTAIKAINLASRSLPSVRVVSFGSHKTIASLKLPPGGEFYLRPSPDKIREIYQRCDVWLSASRSEGFNLTALEAMACGTPVVSTKMGWPLDGIVPGVNGVLTEIDDIEALAEGARWILTRDKHAWEQLSACAYQTMTTRSWDDSAKLFEKAILN